MRLMCEGVARQGRGCDRLGRGTGWGVGQASRGVGVTGEGRQGRGRGVGVTGEARGGGPGLG
jgi:hypothetical protein